MAARNEMAYKNNVNEIRHGFFQKDSSLILTYIWAMDVKEFIRQALQEDTANCDHSSLCCIPFTKDAYAKVVAKQEGIISGTSYFTAVFQQVNPGLQIDCRKKDGERVVVGEDIFFIHGQAQSILMGERVALNILQRMSGISTLTAQYVDCLKDTGTRLLDTRKTTPNFRFFEKEAVRAGGGFNHRMGLYDMIMLKDNHIDFGGGINAAINKANEYRNRVNPSLAIEVECRNLKEVEEVLQTGHVNRIMLDNFTPVLLSEASGVIGRQYETEASGGITLENIRKYALTGVDFISVGALTHSYSSLDFSLKAS
ncbi:MAG: carboxylating nicotinate-nucleotide diphosphorylase [Bacteroidota bacterium]